MKLQQLLPITFLALCSLFPFSLEAARKDVSVLDRSSSGRTVKINAGSVDGLHLREALLVRTGEDKLAAARIISLNPNESVAYLVENYANQELNAGGEYNIIYGVPLDIPDVDDQLLDASQAQSDLPENPQEEKFFTPEGKEVSSAPEIDDERYSPEVSLRPKFPPAPDFSPHNITIGAALFRNRDLAQQEATPANPQVMKSYPGYALRYAYMFRTNFWLRQKTAALISFEGGVGTYSFTHKFASGQAAEINVIPITFNIRYLIELSKMFRVYPYIGYQNNVVPATAANSGSINSLSGGRLLGGLGSILVLSKTMDARLDAGTDNILFGLVTKF